MRPRGGVSQRSSTPHSSTGGVTTSHGSVANHVELVISRGCMSLVRSRMTTMIQSGDDEEEQRNGRKGKTKKAVVEDTSSSDEGGPPLRRATADRRAADRKRRRTVRVRAMEKYSKPLRYSACRGQQTISS
eukprot:1786511-Pleurochrysis_carterae.AAC.2